MRRHRNFWNLCAPWPFGENHKPVWRTHSLFPIILSAEEALRALPASIEAYIKTEGYAEGDVAIYLKEYITELKYYVVELDV